MATRQLQSDPTHQTEDNESPWLANIADTGESIDLTVETVAHHLGRFAAVEVRHAAIAPGPNVNASTHRSPKKSTVRPVKRRRSQRPQGSPFTLRPPRHIRPTLSSPLCLNYPTFNLPRGHQCTDGQSRFQTLTRCPGLRLRPPRRCYSLQRHLNHRTGCTAVGTPLRPSQVQVRCLQPPNSLQYSNRFIPTTTPNPLYPQ